MLTVRIHTTIGTDMRLAVVEHHRVSRVRCAGSGHSSAPHSIADVLHARTGRKDQIDAFVVFYLLIHDPLQKHVSVRAIAFQNYKYVRKQLYFNNC